MDMMRDTAKSSSKVYRWQKLREQRFNTIHRAAMDALVEQKIAEMDLKTLRNAVGLTQKQLAALARISQSQLSKTEREGDHLVSSLRRLVRALGGELEITARFKKHCIKLTGV